MDGGIGQSVVRRDAAAKATGVAQYAADFAHANVAYAALTLGTIAKGRITRIDTTEAEAVPGVQLVLTHASLNEGIGEETFAMKGGHMQSSFMPLTSDEIHYSGQIVALTIADTQEAAEEAARLIRVDYAAVHASAAMDDPDRHEEPMKDAAHDVGDAEAAFAAAEVSVDATYLTPAQHHNPIELYAATAVWRDGKLLLNSPSQWVRGKQAALAKIFGIPMEDVRVESPYIGGGFGGKATLLPHAVLVAMAARRLGRPVKLVVPREAMFTVGSFRPATRSRVRLGARRDGTLTAVIHEQAGQSAEIDHVAFPVTEVTGRMYQCANIKLREATIATDVNTPGFQRAPAEAPGFFGFECAVDELAEKLGIDPVELRIQNEPAKDPLEGLQWSSRSLVKCFRRGAEVFGWNNRNPKPGSMTTADGTLIGYGTATACYPSATAPSSARIRLSADGICEVYCGAHDLGTGAYTVLGQIAADVLGVPNEKVRVYLGDSTLPSGPVAGGSITTGSSGSAVHMAALKVRDAVLRAAGGGTLVGGQVIGSDGKGRSLEEVLASKTGGTIEETADWKPAPMSDDTMRAGLAGGMAMQPPTGKTHASYSFGAQFAEVHVDPLLRTIRVARMVGVFGCGRIINPRTAHSNLAGGMIWGASFALLEETQIDRPRARFANQDLAGYHFSTNADIGEVIAETVEEEDPIVNAIGAKGVGEIGIVGMPAAIANAVYHATGVRVRKTPILIEDLL
jgi:xanthine dehydrogenase YagR molybdenum-binding subunit